MDELDFSKPSKPAAPAAPPVSLAAALDFFRTSGVAENVDTGTNLFVEDEKAGLFSFGKTRKMYLLLEGEVNLIAANKLIGVVKPGEIFGEMAAISDSPRSATAVAQSACRVISLDDKGFATALSKKPEFALMMLGTMIMRLRGMIAKLSGVPTGTQPREQSRVFDKSLLASMVKGLGEQAVVRYEKGKVIMVAGQVGAVMYVVIEGFVSISIRGAVVEKVGPGGIFGEMALIDQSPRAANATAETDCALLGISRQVFLNLVKSEPTFGISLLGAMAERLRNTAAALN